MLTKYHKSAYIGSTKIFNIKDATDMVFRPRKRKKKEPKYKHILHSFTQIIRDNGKSIQQLQDNKRGSQWIIRAKKEHK